MIELSQLQNMSTTQKYPKNTVIINEGEDMPYSMYIVLQGSVRVVKNYGKFDQIVVANLSPGDFFGEMSLFLLKPRTATVVTAQESVVLEINQTNVYDLIRESPQLLFSILRTLCSRIDELNDRVRSVSMRH